MRTGARDELRRVYHQHVDAVFAFFAATVERHTAEDLTASTFERVIRGWGRYDARVGSERAWVMAVARNVLLDHLRRYRLRAGPSLEEHPGLLDILAADWTEQRLTAAELQGWLSCLAERDREVLILRYGADLRAADIGTLLGLSDANVHQIISRALRRLRAAIEETASSGARGE